MSLRVRLAWAFAIVAFTALLVAFVGLGAGLFTSMDLMHGRGPMMMRGPVFDGRSLFNAVLQWSFISSLTALVAAGFAGYWAAGRTTRSLRHLRDATQRLDLRELSLRVPVSGDDEIAELGQAFNRMVDRLEAEERSRRQLLADVAHELRHPLAVLQGRLELMQDGIVPVTPEAMVPLQDGVIRLTRLVGDLRDLSLAEVGGLSLHLSPQAIGPLLADLLDNLEPVAAAKEIALTAEIAPDLPLLPADADRIRQVFVNLLSNALQFTPAGGKVQVRTWREPGEVRVQVADTGPGIAPEDLPHIFDRFFRGDRSRSRATGGSGLGLAIVRSLVELHHGRISVESPPALGSCSPGGRPRPAAVLNPARNTPRAGGGSRRPWSYPSDSSPSTSRSEAEVTARIRAVPVPTLITRCGTQPVQWKASPASRTTC